ncbi:hypothetical protein WT49_11315 [Burkholderia territorii]|uniref:hypothetical protein n=1 Tax=Burkholderia territorii TaxID=1503055 RepID=UPI00075E2E94|nr:hypothetical protein [Burkholderia territorii]KVL50014.1 hypothetical protein WT00_18870 [Burkholderia territorii]KWE37416.1 hypothetical protein WT49_11315 [Burkholderia territorii]KWE38456.1 hypothetical protein WT50_20170 [Burkholderia territorii]KWE40335.1 hypothetical protein WT51_28065 [Burkholderia territorii]
MNDRTTLEECKVLHVGQVWRAKRPSNANGFVNDRVIIHINFLGAITYDGPAVGIGRRYPIVTRETFEKWAGRQVKDELPENEWQRWDFRDRSRNK